MHDGLRGLDVDLNETDFFITHLHADHFGLVSELVTPASRTYFNRPDTEIIEAGGGWETMIEYGGRNGFPRDALRAALKSHPGYKFGSGRVPELSLLQDQEAIEAGRYLFRCIQTPGHTRGHTCLYEPAKKILISGDHILEDITPHIQCWTDGEDPLRSYLASLDRVQHLDVDLVLPGHRRLFRDLRKRIAELKEHHRKRAEEVLEILTKGPKTAFQVASEMTWDISYDSWERFPLTQKWFATGEAIAHLRYLEEKGSLTRKSDGGVTLFTLG
jgi:glyoxylase-like metal-dependent hydrolase (beta-lactamase superfamily II)